MKGCLCFLGLLLLRPAVLGQSTNAESRHEVRTERRILEEKHFVESLAFVYSPALWIGYKGSLYFAPKDEAQAGQIEALKAARSRYVALTNREVRHEIASAVIAESGLGEDWQKKLLLPYSEAYPNLTPTLSRAFRAIDGYKVAQVLEEGDALIQVQDTTYLVMNFSGHGTDGSRTNLFLIKEGERAFATAPGEYKRVEAFTSAGLSKEETLALNRVVAAFQKRAAALAQELAGFKAKQEFEAAKARASDNNPYMQYLVARCYLNGRGTQKDEKLGLEWMNKAARNGSGDARSYLDGLGQKPD